MRSEKILSILARPVLTLVIIGMVSCGGEKKTETSSEFDNAASGLKDQVEKVIYEIPSPSEIPYVIQATGADYNGDLVNDIGKVTKYQATPKIAALNLGVYATDVGYLITYEKVQDALKYMQGCLDIGDYIGLKNALDAAIVDRFQKNLNTKDSLANIINQAISNSDQYLQDTERNNIAALVIAGTFIEGLYISTQLVDTYPKDMLPDDSRNLILTPLIRLILDQEESLEDMINLLKSITFKDDWIEGLINSMVELKGNFEELKIKDQISNNRADLVLTDKTLERITTQIEKIRTTVTY